MKKYRSFDEAMEDIPSYRERQYETQANIAKRIRELMSARGMTQKQLADDLEMSESQVSWILSGEANITIKTISKFEAYFNADILDIAKISRELSVSADVSYGNDKTQKIQKADWIRGAAQKRYSLVSQKPLLGAE